MQAIDFELTITRTNTGAYQVSAWFNLDEREPAIEVQTLNRQGFTLPLFDDDKLYVDAQEYGRRLAEMLFKDQAIRGAWNQATSAAQRLHTALRLRLHLDPTDASLHGIPWETLADPISGAPLVLSSNVVLSRYLRTERADTTPRRSALRALVAVASPSTTKAYLEDIELDVERAREVLGNLSSIAMANSATNQAVNLRALAESLRNSPDIFYLICHGSSVNDHGYVWLENNQGQSQPVSVKEIPALLRQLPQPPLLVVLASCQSAGHRYGEYTSPYESAASAFGSLGVELLQAGVSAVIAMQSPISSTGAQAFASVFFRELARHGLVDQAVTVARAMIRHQENWWQPVLYQSITHGHLCEPLTVTKINRRNQCIYRESDALGNVDGILVSDGAQGRITLRSSLSPAQKEQAQAAFLRQLEANYKPGVYFWSATKQQVLSGQSSTPAATSTSTVRCNREIARLRTARGWSRATLTLKLRSEFPPDTEEHNKVSEHWLREVEEGRKTKMSRPMLEALCRALQCSERERARIFLYADRSVVADNKDDPHGSAVAEILSYMTLALYDDAKDVIASLIQGRPTDSLTKQELLLILKMVVEQCLKNNQSLKD